MTAVTFAHSKSVPRRARLIGTLSPEERETAAAAEVPSPAEQKRYLAKLVEAVGGAPSPTSSPARRSCPPAP
jgi:hypothetical protein